MLASNLQVKKMTKNYTIERSFEGHNLKYKSEQSKKPLRLTAFN